MEVTDINTPFYNGSFFGFGELGDFQQWSVAHIVPILVCIVAIILVYRFRKKLKNWKREETFRFVFAAIMIFVDMSYYWRLLYVGTGGTTLLNDSLMSKLPLQVCTWTLYFTSFMMMKKSQNLFQLSFFLCLSASIFPFILPGVISSTGPGYYRYYQFWLEHIMPVVGMFYMMFVFDFKPKLKGIAFTYGFLVLLSVPSIYLNSWVPGACYMYLTNTSTIPMLDMLPNSLVVSVIAFSLIIIGLMLLVYFIYWLITVKAKTKLSKN